MLTFSVFYYRSSFPFLRKTNPSIGKAVLHKINLSHVEIKQKQVEQIAGGVDII
jgi:hypothetical protein